MKPLMGKINPAKNWPEKQLDLGKPERKLMKYTLLEINENLAHSTPARTVEKRREEPAMARWRCGRDLRT